jgi:DNA-binding response OmpR family regulator
MYFPAAAEAAEHAPAAQRTPIESLQGARVLLVEDNAEVAAGTLAVLASMGCTAGLAADAERAIEGLREGAHRFDIMITDIVLAGSRDGIELAAWARTQTPGLALLLMTGYSESMERAAALKLDVLAKPCSPAALAAAMSAALLRVRRERAEAA